MTRNEKKQFAAGIISLVISVACLVMVLLQPGPAPVPVPTPLPLAQVVPVDSGAENLSVTPNADAIDPVPPGAAFGHVPNAAAIKAFLATQQQSFSATPTGQTQEIPRYAYLWQTHKALLGSMPPEKDQNPVGMCVGMGNTTAIERSEAGEIYARLKNGLGDPSEFTFFCEEAIYAGSRVEVNGGRSPIQPTARDRDGDGSNQAWAVKWAIEHGMLPKGKYGTWNMTTLDPMRARAWQFKGVPDELEPECAKYKVGDAAQITTWTDAKRALSNGYAIAVCSDIGYNGQRDANGVARPGPTWQHCMCIDGYHIDEQGHEYGHIENSWAKTGYHKGPVGWGSPSNAGFWTDAKNIQRMLSQGESFAYSGVKGFPRQAPLDWYAAIPARRRFDVAANFKEADLLSLKY